MIQLKGCPKCKGDLCLNRGLMGDRDYWSCLQCGYEVVPEPIKIINVPWETTPGTRWCTQCNQFKPSAQFRTYPNGGKVRIRSSCRSCEGKMANARKVS